MKKLLAMVLAAALCVGVSVPALAADGDIASADAAASEVSVGKFFRDVPDGSAYADAINWAFTKRIAVGDNEKCFKPDEICTVGQAITFLWRCDGSPQPTIQNPFTDVSADAFDGQAAIWAYEKGLVSGSVFDGNRPCTRREVVTYMWKRSGRPQAAKATTNAEREWNLLLVNPWNRIPQGFSVNLASVGGGHSVDARCASALTQMLADCRAAGLSRAAAETRTAKSTAVPGTSEHQIGLAVDIVDNRNRVLNNTQASTPAQKWLMAHSWEYGFTLRYPNGKTDVTGILYEPWHYRYVGKEAAAAMHERGICMEEYLQELEGGVDWVIEQRITACKSAAEFAPDTNCTRGEMMMFLYRTFVQRA